MPHDLPPIQGNLFTRDFLAEAIRQTPEYLGINDHALDLFAADLRQLFEALPIKQSPNESQTEDDLIWPVLSRLGWSSALRQQNLAARGREDVPDGVLFENESSKAQANTHPEEWRRYAHGLAIVESKRWGRPLDRRTSGKRGAEEASAPSTQMLRYLRRVDDLTGGKLRWGILSNGARWRLYYQGAKSVSEDFFDIDLADLLAIERSGTPSASEATRRHGLRLFLTIFRRDAFVAEGPSGSTFHRRALEQGRYYEERVSASLSSLVYDRAYPMLSRAIAEAAPEAPLSEVRDAGLVLLYRLLFLLYAEDRNLLPVTDRRYNDYSLRSRVREDVGRRKDQNDIFSTTASRYWSVIDDLTRAIDKGDASIGLPPYNGGLFDGDRTPLLAKVRVSDAVVADIIDALSFDRTEGRRRYINYRDLSVQQLGSIYERLLEHELTGEDGLVDVRPNRFARKNSGSYYTPDELVRLIVRETLEPMITDHLEAFRQHAEQLATDSRPTDRRLALLDHLDPAVRMLDLKICDPAMGSGHFLVSLVDYLTDQVIAALAEAEAMVDWGEYVSPLAERIANIRRTILANADRNGWMVELDQLDDRHIIRRMVLKRCVYGVDKNPMAVELAKVSLWLHTFTVGAPLSFLDHHLRTGDSLFGAWVSDTMSAVVKRGGKPLLLHGSIREAMGSAAAMRVIEELTDAEIAEARNSADMFAGVRIRTAPLDRFMAMLHALDWLNLRNKEDRSAIQAWLDGAFGDAIDIALGKTAVPTTRADGMRFAAILAEARALVDEQGFLNWQVAFPGVWDEWEADGLRGGFDAVIGNPPWDRMKLQQVEWFASRRAEIALVARASDRMRMISSLQASGDPLAADFAHAAGRAETAARVVRDGGDYPLLSGGDINLYSLFVERAMRLVRGNGIVGLLTPSGIASDKTAAPFFRRVATGGRLKALYDFENRRTNYRKEPFFPDVDSRFKFCAFVASPERRFAQAHCGFFLQATAEIADAERAFPITAADFRSVNPNTGTAPIFRSARDAALITGIYGRVPVLADHGVPEHERSWQLRYCTMFHMTNDSHLFRTANELAADGWYPVGSRHWRKGDQEAVPLYTGRMFHQFDHRASGVEVNDENLHNTAQSDRTSGAEKANPNFHPTPQYWVPWDYVEPKRHWALAFRDIARPTDARTMIAAMLPGAAYGNKAPLLLMDDPINATMLLGNLNAFVLDFVARSKIQSANANWYIVEQLPILPVSAYDRTFGDLSAREIVTRDVLALSYTSHELAKYAGDLGFLDNDGGVKSPVPWDDDDRAQRRARLDALYFHLYGIAIEEADYILSTFPIIRRQDEASFGYFASRDLILHQMNALEAGDVNAVIRRGGPIAGGE
ncbi:MULTISPECIES: restriction endonuclease [Sinorhizobium]|uniref:Eco57I restriction-modification methylase domain-containing protein n=1 Tax=Sinorhizobium TaxID=28105 RepID=UPI000BEA7865|nr:MULTISPECIES: restriction endonuclease [Sinorhizobium]PDT50854.1 restriction endonuclease [Sinorhizobium sp. NG07B]POH24975.1 restriction endonuclease [Sinorhizobium americanum]